MKPEYSCPSCHQGFSRKWNRERHTKTVHSRGASVLSNILFYDYTTTRDAKQSRSILDMPAALETGKTNDMFDEFIIF